MKALYCEQRTQEWYEARCGRVTGSNIGAVMSMLKKGGKTRERWAYKVDVLTEQLTGEPVKHYVSPYMQKGIDDEPLAIREYERRSGEMVIPVGFVFHPTIEMAGCSPDGLIGDDRILEAKNLEASNHIAAILHGQVPSKYYDQIQFGLRCTERKGPGIYLLNCEEQPMRYRQFVIEVPRDEARIAEIDDGVRMFLGEVDRLRESLDQRCPLLPEELAEGVGELGLTEDDLAILDRARP
jgi:exodeoxyribonuclease (lambda-induced)